MASLMPLRSLRAVRQRTPPARVLPVIDGEGILCSRCADPFSAPILEGKSMAHSTRCPACRKLSATTPDATCPKCSPGITKVLEDTTSWWVDEASSAPPTDAASWWTAQPPQAAAPAAKKSKAPALLSRLDLQSRPGVVAAVLGATLLLAVTCLWACLPARKECSAASRSCSGSAAARGKSKRIQPASCTRHSARTGSTRASYCDGETGA